MSKAASATHDTTGVLDDNIPGARRVGADRLAALDTLAEGRREAVARESGVEIPAAEAEVKTDDAKAEEPKVEKAEEPKAETAKADDQLAAQAAADDRVVLEGDLSKYFIKSKVDGQDTEIPLAKAHRLLQKDAAVDRRLEAATRAKEEAEIAKKEADGLLAKARASGDDAAIRRAEADTATAARTAANTTEKFDKFATAIFGGDTQAAKTAFDELLDQQRGKTEAATADPNQVAEIVIAQVEQRSALRQFQTSYPDIVANPVLTEMANKEIRELMQHEGLTFADALPKAGAQVREAIKDMAKTYGMTEGKQAATVRDATVQSRKAEIDEPTAVRASAQANTSGSDTPASPSAVIDEMRAVRMGRTVKPPA